MKKTFLSIGLCICLFLSSTLSISVNAASLSYWESDSDRIGKFTSAPKVYRSNLSSNSSFKFTSATTHAVTQWKNAGMSSSFTPDPFVAKIFYYGGTRAQLNALGVHGSKYTSTTLGMTSYTNTTFSKNYTYNKATKKLYKHNKIYTSLCYNSASVENNYKKTATHELGHALGWRGHSAGSSNIMTQGLYKTTALTAKDKRHLKQVY